MFKTNVGGFDRILRIVLGLALIVLFFLDADASWRWAYLIGVVVLATGVFSTCPLYSALGFSTCPVKRG